MAKYSGQIGYSIMVETAPDVYKPQIVEHHYVGDRISNKRRLSSGDQLNDNISITTDISIVADPFAYTNFHNIVYATDMGIKWKVTSVDATQRPRLILTLGEVYNGTN